MNDKLKRYLQEKLKNNYRQLNHSLEEYFKYLEKKEKLQEELNYLEACLETEKFLNPSWEDGRHKPETFKDYEKVLEMEIEVAYKQKEIVEVMQNIINTRLQVEQKKKSVIDCKVDLHWISDDDLL